MIKTMCSDFLYEAETCTTHKEKELKISDVVIKENRAKSHLSVLVSHLCGSFPSTANVVNSHLLSCYKSCGLTRSYAEMSR